MSSDMRSVPGQQWTAAREGQAAVSERTTHIMQSTLYSWTFKFHEVVRQQNSGAVEDFILPIPQFIYESKSERIIEIGPHLPTLS